MSRIIMPGDRDFHGPTTKDQKYAPQTPKLPNEMLEKVFADVVQEVKEQLDVTDKADPADAVVPAEAVPPNPPGPTFKFHRPSKQKSFTIPMPKPLLATLLEDLPRAWEEKCYVGGVDYVAVEGQPYKNRVRRPGFCTGDQITLTGMVLFDSRFYKDAGAMYEFEEGKRGSFCVRPDQVSFELPKLDTPPVLDALAEETLSPKVGANE